MANVSTHRAAALKPETVIATIIATGAADVAVAAAADADTAFPMSLNPENIVSTFRRSAEGEVTITLAQAWAALDNCLVSCSIDDTNVTLDSEDVDGAKTIVFTTVTGGSAADADAGVLRVTLVLRTL